MKYSVLVVPYNIDDDLITRLNMMALLIFSESILSMLSRMKTRICEHFTLPG